MLQNLHECASPEGVLMSAFATCIRDAYRECPNIYKFGVKIDNDNLNFPIELPFRTLWQNSPGAMLNEFLKVMQSNNEAGVYGRPIRVVLTAIEGAAGGHPSHMQVRHLASPASLIKVQK